MKALYRFLTSIFSFGTYSSTQAALSSNSTAFEASRVVKASAGNFFGVVGYNNAAFDQYIQVHNAAALPADGAVPVFVIKARANDNYCIDIGNIPVNFSNGVVICNSSTAATKTIGAADCWFNAKYN